MLHAPPPLNYGPGVPAAGAGPAYLRKHSFFDLDEDEDDEVFDSSKKEALSTGSGSSRAAGSSPSARSGSATGYGSTGPQKGPGSGGGSQGSPGLNHSATSSVSPASPSPPGSFAAPASSPGQTAAAMEANKDPRSYADVAAAGLSNKAGGNRRTATSTAPDFAFSGDDDAARAAGNAGGRSGTGGANIEEAGRNNEAAGGRLVDGVGGGGGGGAHGSSTQMMRGGRRTVAGAMERRRMLLVSAPTHVCVSLFLSSSVHCHVVSLSMSGGAHAILNILLVCEHERNPSRVT